MTEVETPKKALKPRTAKGDTKPYDDERERALFNLRFTADRLSGVSVAVHSVLRANLLRAGFDLPLDVKTRYSESLAADGSYGSVHCEVKADFKRADVANVSINGVTNGLPVQTRYGTPVHRFGDITQGSFSFSMHVDNQQMPLTLLRATLEQERALSKALASLRDQVQSQGVHALVSDGTGEDAQALESERKLTEEVEELERQLQERRDQLRAATQTANAVRERLRKASNPAVDALVGQVNMLRERLGMALT